MSPSAEHRPPASAAAPGHLSPAQEAAAREAAQWIVSLGSDDPEERRRAREGFAAWKAADPRHAAAAADMEAFLDRARGLVGQAGAGCDEAPPAARAARATLAALVGRGAGDAARRARMKRIGGVLGLAVAAAAVLTLAMGSPAVMLADLHTSAGERHHEILPDGTRLTLSTATAANFRVDGLRRCVRLLQGEIHVDVARDEAHPFVVETPHGRIRALGTRFIVRNEADATLLTMLESRTEVSTAAPAPRQAERATRTVGAGQQVRLSKRGIETVGEVDSRLQEEAFMHRRLVANDRPLPDVLDELGRHRGGLVRYRRGDVEGLRVTAVLPLDDTDQALRLLLAEFPQLRMHTLTPWLVLIGPRG